jgi:hypothetical protein
LTPSSTSTERPGLEGVNALASGQTIDFDPCLTVLFGKNGSGKTGYARVLKRLAAVRTAEPILPNAHKPGEQPVPTGVVRYALDSVEQTIAWQDEAGVSPLTRMSVFDAHAVNLHVDDELVYVFTPRELALFSHVTSAIRSVQESLAAEATTLRPTGGNPFLGHFRRGSDVYAVVESLGATTELAELEALADQSPEGEAVVAALADEIAALRGGGVEARLGVAKQKLERLRRAFAICNVLGTFDAAAYASSLAALRQLYSDRRTVRGQLFTSDELPGEADDIWQSFITSADHYREHLGLADYPTDGARCLYCRQPLAPEALDLLRRYKTFLDDELARQIVEAETAFRSHKLAHSGISLDMLREDLRQSEEEPPSPYSAQLGLLLDRFERVKAASEAESDLPSDDLSDAVPLLSVLATARDEGTAVVSELNQQLSDRTHGLADREAKHAQLLARRTLGRHLEAMRAFVSDAKRAGRLEAFGKAMSGGLLRGLTLLSKQASEELVNRDFQRLFEEECEALRAPAVALEFQGRQGRAERKKAVARYKPSAVLSEGEQKVLAIADFLAESRMSGVKAPIIFDDPVTSLDYERLGEVAQRISRLAETHQVVVLTHNVFFASTLLALRNSKKLKCKFYEVRESETAKGYIQPDVEPRQDTPAEIGKKINVIVEQAGRAGPVIQDALIENCYGLMRSWCEAFVEQELLQNVSQRFRVNIMMGGLEKIRLDRFDAAVQGVLPVFDRCSRFMPGHAQPAEQLNVKPVLDDLRKDWESLQAVRTAYITK